MSSRVRRGAACGDMPLSPFLSAKVPWMHPSGLIAACVLVLKRSHPIRSCMGKRRVSPYCTFHIQPVRLGRSHVHYFLQSQRLDGLVAQHKLLHLAAGRQRIGIYELDVARDLLMADLALAVVAQFLLGKLLAWFGDNHRQQLFTKEGVWDSHHLHISYLGMADEEGLDRLGSLLRHLVVTCHDYAATIAEFAALPNRHQLARCWINDFDLDMG